MLYEPQDDATENESVENAKDRSRGIAQIAAGGALATAGVAMLILPGPGVAAITGGLALAGRGYTNLTGKEVISEETKNDSSYKAGQAAGEEFAQRVREFASNELAPATRALANDASQIARDAKIFAIDTASTTADLAGKGFRAVVGDNAADKVQELGNTYVLPTARGAAQVGGTVAKAAGGAAVSAATAAGTKLAEKAKGLIE